MAQNPATPRVLSNSGAALDRRTLQVAAGALHDVVALEDGLAWTEDGAVWIYDYDAPAPRQLAEFCDPHSLTTNGSKLAWLGCETNAVHDIATGVTTNLPLVGPPYQANALVFVGPDLVAANHTGLLWRYVNDAPEKLYMHIPGDWVWWYRGLASGGDRLFFAAAREGLDSERLGRVTLHPRPEMTELELGPARSQSGWVANERGDVLFVDHREREVWVVPRGATTAKRAVRGTTVEAACWCGTEVCTLGDGVLRKHRRHDVVEVAVPEIRDAGTYGCGHGRLVVAHDEEMLSSLALP